jgi:hypothetical protein
MPAADRWRARFLSGGGRAAGASELIFASSIGGAQIATGGTAISSSNWSGAYLPANAFDGNNNSSWYALADTGYPTDESLCSWVGYIFPSAVDVAEVRYREVHDSEYYTSNFAVDYSLDGGSSWIEEYRTGLHALDHTTLRSYPNPKKVTPSGNLHRAWRVRPTRIQGTTQQALLPDLQWAATPGGSNLATGGWAFCGAGWAASDSFGSYEPAKGFDGSAATAWFNSAGSTSGVPPTNAWLAYAFPSGAAPGELRIVSRAATANMEGLPKDFVAEWTDDWVTWTAALTVTNEPAWVGGEVRTYSLAPAPARRRPIIIL